MSQESKINRELEILEIAKNLYMSNDPKGQELLDLKKEKEYLINSIKNMKNAIEVAETSIEGIQIKIDNLKKEIENKDCSDIKAMIKSILTMEEVEGIQYDVETDSLILNTTRLVCTDGKNNYFQLGKYEITVYLINNDVRFICLEEEYKRRSYWGGGNHHPHVSSSGNACLGNANEMIVHALQAKDYHILSIILIDFLKQVNVDDPAGRYVANWDCIDIETGEIIDNPYSKDKCDTCGRFLDEDYNVCDICGRKMCEDCSHSYMEDGYVCGVCIDSEEVLYCDVCGEYYPYDNLYSLVNSNDKICDNCIERYSKYTDCECCGEIIDTSKDSYFNVDEEAYCETCVEDKLSIGVFFECDECEKIYHEDDRFVINGRELCDECYRNYLEEECITDEEQTEDVNEVVGVYTVDGKKVKAVCTKCDGLILEDDDEYINSSGTICCEKCYREGV